MSLVQDCMVFMSMQKEMLDKVRLHACLSLKENNVNITIIVLNKGHGMSHQLNNTTRQRNLNDPEYKGFGAFQSLLCYMGFAPCWRMCGDLSTLFAVC